MHRSFKPESDMPNKDSRPDIQSPFRRNLVSGNDAALPNDSGSTAFRDVPPMSRTPLYYGDYLQVDRLLSLQVPESAKHGPSVHDEMLFIIVHQAYELWFKQMLHEFDRVERDFSTNPVNDEAMARIVHSLARVHEILKLLVAQFDVLETMTPADFLDFRDYLFPASGFQSLQFRLIETRLGLPDGTRVQFDGEALEARLSVTDRQKLAAARLRPTIHALLDKWLARTPF